ncbi:GNAT family N-acetyltransferase [Vibrio profundum]|uniref:GNAT family N-acetyltransferase n=1 Tax=Vibrio profundum TaxID=2910247 RepID=UPI003D0A9FC2
MKLKPLKENQLHHLLNETEFNSEVTFCAGSIPPKHVLQRSHDHVESSKAEIWSLPYMMLLNENVVGFCGFKDEPRNHAVEIGYNVSPEQQGKGFAKVAVHQLCKIAFDSGSVQQVVALVSPTNLASLNVVKANSFICEGVVEGDDNEDLQMWILNLVSCT